ncbi:MAG TPA: hypothetical protein VEQ84_04925, partial [Vicinamibacteria bacterium]|nr:hypothetical protein [Vicinamibacteria bacterium]
MMSNLRLLAAGLAALAAVVAPRPPSVLADRVFLGGRIWTGDPAQPRAQGIALAGDVIVAVGTDAEVRPCIGPATTTVTCTAGSSPLVSMTPTCTSSWWTR